MYSLELIPRGNKSLREKESFVKGFPGLTRAKVVGTVKCGHLPLGSKIMVSFTGILTTEIEGALKNLAKRSATKSDHTLIHLSQDLDPEDTDFEFELPDDPTSPTDQRFILPPTTHGYNPGKYSFDVSYTLSARIVKPKAPSKASLLSIAAFLNASRPSSPPMAKEHNFTSTVVIPVEIRFYNMHNLLPLLGTYEEPHVSRHSHTKVDATASISSLLSGRASNIEITMGLEPNQPLKICSATVTLVETHTVKCNEHVVSKEVNLVVKHFGGVDTQPTSSFQEMSTTLVVPTSACPSSDALCVGGMRTVLVDNTSRRNSMSSVHNAVSCDSASILSSSYGSNHVSTGRSTLAVPSQSSFYMGSNASYTQLIHEPIMSEDACFAVKHALKFQIRVDCGNYFQTLRFEQPFTISSTNTMHILELLDHDEAKALIPPQSYEKTVRIQEHIPAWVMESKC